MINLPKPYNLMWFLFLHSVVHTKICGIICNIVCLYRIMSLFQVFSLMSSLMVLPTRCAVRFLELRIFFYSSKLHKLSLWNFLTFIINLLRSLFENFGSPKQLFFNYAQLFTPCQESQAKSPIELSIFKLT